jgi:hypothetical protein
MVTQKYEHEVREFIARPHSRKKRVPKSKNLLRRGLTVGFLLLSYQVVVEQRETE